VLLAGAGSSVARADPPPPPLPSLRHLVFAVDLGLKDEYEKRLQTSRRITVTRSARSSERLPPDQRTATYDRHLNGRIVCDVVAATPDGGLVVDISEDATERSAAPVRVAVEPNGHLNYSPSTTVFEEEVALLRLLARSIVGSQPHDVGASWVVEDSGKGYGSKTTFRVTAVQAAGDLRLDLEQQYHQEGIDGVVGSVQGKVAYDQSKLVPRTASFGAQARRETPDGYRIVSMDISLTLVQDSFGR
jgi:hypothetical protein